MSAPDPPPEQPSWQSAFEVLFVCTGNICRSAFAEMLARQLLVDRLGRAALQRFAFASAGVRATPGQPIHPSTRSALAVWGVGAVETGPAAFRSRRLDEKAIAGADLILTAEEAHRAAIVWLAPEALPKAYGMRRFARMLRTVDQGLLPADPVRRASRIMELAPRLHAALPPVPLDQEAIPDPINRGPRDHLLAADLVFDVVCTYIDVLAPPLVTDPPPHW